MSCKTLTLEKCKVGLNKNGRPQTDWREGIREEQNEEEEEIK